MKKYFLALVLALSVAPAFGDPPPAVPALPDTERRTSYSLSASTCACSVGFALYGDSTDYGNWIEVYLTTGSGASATTTELVAGTDYTLTSPSGSLANLPRPITNATITLTSASTGTLQIVGARRPRRTTQFSENRGVAARDLNQALTDIVAQNRETWDRTNDVAGRALLVPPGDTLTAFLPPLSQRAGQVLAFDANGNPVAAPGGSVSSSSQITFLQSGTGAVTRTMQDKARDAKSLFDYIPPSLQAGIVAGTNTTDLTPYVRAAIAANSNIVAPCGTYLFNTSTASGYESRGLGPYVLTVQNRTSFRLVGEAPGCVTFMTGNSAALSDILWVFQSANIEVGNINFVGNNTGLTFGQNNGALSLYSVKNFWVHDIQTSVFQGSHIVGNWQFNGVYERISQSVPAAATGFDVASLQNITIRNFTAVGASGGQGFQHIYDAPNANPTYNTTGITLCAGCAVSMSNHIRIENADLSGFTTAVAVSEARDVWLVNSNIHENLTGSGTFSVGAAFSVANIGTVAYNINVVDNRFSNNGSPVGDAGLRGGLALNSNVGLVYATVTGNSFVDNYDSGIVNTGRSTTAYITGNYFGNIATANQTNTISFPSFFTAATIITGNIGQTIPMKTGWYRPDGATTALSVNDATVFAATAANANVTVPFTFGVVGNNLGKSMFAGSTSGFATVQAQPVQGTPTILWPTASGTVVASAVAPLSVDAATGAASCPTCATTTNGGGTLAAGITASSLTSAAGGTFGTNAFNSTAYLALAGGTMTGDIAMGSHNIGGTGTLKNGAVTVASLPTCNSGAEGTHYGVTDANATTFLTTVAGGGSNHVPVYCNGTNWVIGG